MRSKKNHIAGANHIPLEVLQQQLQSIPTDRLIVVYDETGKKGHQALRTLIGAGFKQVVNVSGGYISLLRHARTLGLKNFKLDIPPVQLKSIHSEETIEKEEAGTKQNNDNAPIVIDVRTVGEFRTGAYPEAINIPLDELPRRFAELGENLNRDITVYCASGARSAYAENLLRQMGFTNVKNGGGITAMMSRRPNKTSSSSQPLIVDVRTVQEFKGGAFPGAVNIPLDELPNRLSELGNLSRDITVYCASGARSSYAQRLLAQSGFTNVKNGGGIMQMMMSR